MSNVFDYIGNLDTLLAVVVGAVLATLGALTADVIQDKTNRKRREQDAARFFGDILSSFDRVLDFTLQSQKVGDPWGATTLRLFKTTQREAAVYERNRERLYDIREVKLRAQIHSHFLREIVPLDAVIENYENVLTINAQLKDGQKRSAADIKRMKESLKEEKSMFEKRMTILKSQRAKAKEIYSALEQIANVKFNETE